MYSYFVSYKSKLESGEISDGMINIKRVVPIECYEDIVELNESIAKDNGFKQVIINNFVKLEF